MIGIIDYGAGNTRSLMNALDRCGEECIRSSNVNELSACNKLILPGVGHAKKAMNTLKDLDLVDFIRGTKKPLLGICLGMQLLCKESEEGETQCINIFPLKVQRFDSNKLKVPKMGWNTTICDDNDLLSGISKEDYFYFVHSYYVPLSENTIQVADYEIKYSVALSKNNFYGVQFHPEKSGRIGQILLQNFIKL